METYDVVMLAVVGGATLWGLLKGFAWQVASVASLVLSYLCAYRFADQLAPHLSTDPRWSKHLAMLIVYSGTGIAVWFAFRFVSKTIDGIKLRDFDRQMGALFGFAKGALLCTVITFFAVSLNENSRAAVLRSKSGQYISRALHKATPIMPPEWIAQLGPYLDKLDRGLDPTQTVEHPRLPGLPLPGGQNLPSAAGPGGSNGGFQTPGVPAYSWSPAPQSPPPQNLPRSPFDPPFSTGPFVAPGYAPGYQPPAAVPGPYSPYSSGGFGNR